MAVSRWLLPVIIGLWVGALPVQLASGQGQSPPEVEPAQIVEEIEMTRAIIQAERKAIVTRAMDLTAAEAQAFLPICRECRLEMVEVGDRLVALITAYAESYRNLSDEMSAKLLTEYLGI